jgi:hypothetical protein
MKRSITQTIFCVRFIGVVFAAAIFGSCTDLYQDYKQSLDANVGTGTVTGTVVDVVSNTALSDVSIEVKRGSTRLATTTTGSTGAYSLLVSAYPDLTITFTKSGYLSATYENIPITANDTTYLESVLYISSSYAGTGSASGIISDAYSGNAVSGAGIKLYSGINNTSGVIAVSTATDASGVYTVSNLSAGQYTAQVTKDNYTTATFTLVIIGNQTRSDQNFAITSVLDSSATRIVLTWGSSPNDLDSHLKTPSAYHVFFSNKGSASSSPYVALDHDDTSSYGPETITIYTQESGDYYYYVHDFSNESSVSSSALASSMAVVKVYMGGILKATYNVPSKEGTLWKVFKLNGTTLTPINAMLYESSSSDVSSNNAVAPFKSIAPSDDLCLFRNLPAKN